jgi:hypothetical protein
MSARPNTAAEVVPDLWRVFVYFWPYIRKHRAILVRSTLMLVCGVVVGLLEPWPLKFVLDNVDTNAAVRGRNSGYSFRPATAHSAAGTCGLCPRRTRGAASRCGLWLQNGAVRSGQSSRGREFRTMSTGICRHCR